MTPNSERILPDIGMINKYYEFYQPPTHIIDNIYLGSAFNAASYQVLKDNNIKMIINVTKSLSNYHENTNEFIYKKYPIYDDNEASIQGYLNSTLSDILSFQKQNYLQNKSDNILVHCFMGASRSASIVINYLMLVKNMSFDDALKFIHKKRIVVNPTKKYESDLR
jgi:atypical dual specificity phosphatase